MKTIITPAPVYQKPSGNLYLSANQLNLVDGTWTWVELDTIKTGFADGIEDTTNYIITPAYAGWYDIKAQVYFMNVIADKRYYASIYLNGVTEKVTATKQASIAEYLSIGCSNHIKMSATDYIKLKARSNAGVDTVDILAGEQYTFLSIQRVR